MQCSDPFPCLKEHIIATFEKFADHHDGFPLFKGTRLKVVTDMNPN